MRRSSMLAVLVGCGGPYVPPTAPYAGEEPVVVEDSCGMWTAGMQNMPVPETLTFVPGAVGYEVDDGFDGVGCEISAEGLLTCETVERRFPQDGAMATIVQLRRLTGTFDRRTDALHVRAVWEVSCDGSDCQFLTSDPPLPCVQDLSIDFLPG